MRARPESGGHENRKHKSVAMWPFDSTGTWRVRHLCLFQHFLSRHQSLRHHVKETEIERRIDAFNLESLNPVPQQAAYRITVLAHPGCLLKKVVGQLLFQVTQLDLVVGHSKEQSHHGT